MAKKRYRVAHLSAWTWEQGTELSDEEIKAAGFEPADWLASGAVVAVDFDKEVGQSDATGKGVNLGSALPANAPSGPAADGPLTGNA